MYMCIPVLTQEVFLQILDCVDPIVFQIVKSLQT